MSRQDIQKRNGIRNSLFTGKEDNGNIALLWNTEQCKRGFKLEEKKQLWKIRFLTKNKKDINKDCFSYLRADIFFNGEDLTQIYTTGFISHNWCDLLIGTSLLDA